MTRSILVNTTFYIETALHTKMAANKSELGCWGIIALSSGQVSASCMTFPESSISMCVAAFLMSQKERTKLIKPSAFKQQPRGGGDAWKALAVRQAMCRALKTREYKQMRVMGLSIPISQFQNDSTQVPLGKAGLFTKR